MKKMWTALLLCGALLSLAACGGGDTPATLSGSVGASSDFGSGFLNTAATDDYGRSFSATGGYDENTYVGIFYFLWNSSAYGVHDVSEYEKRGEVESVLTGDTVPGAPNFTYWGKPLYDYYSSTDTWVIRKHLELFMNAGLDFIAFDCTNSQFYSDAAYAFLDVALEYQQMGYDVPKIMFMTNTEPVPRTTQIYNALYQDDYYESLWFKGTGDKPWIISEANNSSQLDSEIRDRFYFKKAQWPNEGRNENNFPWMSWTYPQETFRDGQVGNIMSVSVAQHPGDGRGVDFSDSGMFAPYNYDTLSDSAKAAVSEERAETIYNSNWGRGYSHETGENDIDRVNEGVNFEEQWATALDEQNDIDLVFVTGWNEWIAQKQSGSGVLGSQYGRYIDLFNREFSRDVEMMDGEYLDNCYLQLVRNTRAFKTNAEAQTFADRSDFAAAQLGNWADVSAVYKDLVRETLPRRDVAVDGGLLENKTGRNDIQEVRVASDAENIYFLIRTVDDITAKSAQDTRWMNLYIGVEGASGGWNGLQFVVNRELTGTTSKLQTISGNTFADHADAQTLVSGNLMLVTVRKSDLGITGSDYTLNFKVCDNLQEDFDIADTYINGDCAPIGRINYTYSVKGA